MCRRSRRWGTASGNERKVLQRGSASARIDQLSHSTHASRPRLSKLPLSVFSTAISLRTLVVEAGEGLRVAYHPLASLLLSDARTWALRNRELRRRAQVFASAWPAAVAVRTPDSGGFLAKLCVRLVAAARHSWPCLARFFGTSLTRRPRIITGSVDDSS
jgi:hypothetical protein